VGGLQQINKLAHADAWKHMCVRTILAQSLRRHSQPARDFSNAVTSLNYLPDRFNLELLGISFATHLHLSCCHFEWLKGV
jgi:hypothetical protein